MSRLSRSKSKHNVNNPRVEEDEKNNRISNGTNNYQIGNEIGKGGFAVVFQALNVNNGDFVAVKRFPLSSIDNDANIESEIELMQKLNHPNIVKYIDTIKTKSFLYIVLEFIENGSLSNVIKKFGALTEPLTAIYVTQILRGLKYLHEQGVLHRDIKGANILTTKEGLVKLADFGVAMKQSDTHIGLDIAGSPYWMAPEIIDMATPTTACDIWSVGCTVIELLTGKPPYFDLAPMAALFRIVSDDYPPMPEGISQALRDFLFNCFQKEPVMRSTAEKLLTHPWIQNAPSNNRISQVAAAAAASHSSSSHDNTSDSNLISTILMHQRSGQEAITSADAIAMRGIQVDQHSSISQELSTSNEQLRLKSATEKPPMMSPIPNRQPADGTRDQFPEGPRHSEKSQGTVPSTMHTIGPDNAHSYVSKETLINMGLFQSTSTEVTNPTSPGMDASAEFSDASPTTTSMKKPFGLKKPVIHEVAEEDDFNEDDIATPRKDSRVNPFHNKPIASKSIDDDNDDNWDNDEFVAKGKTNEMKTIPLPSPVNMMMVTNLQKGTSLPFTLPKLDIAKANTKPERPAPFNRQSSTNATTPTSSSSSSSTYNRAVGRELLAKTKSNLSVSNITIEPVPSREMMIKSPLNLSPNIGASSLLKYQETLHEENYDDLQDESESIVLPTKSNRSSALHRIAAEMIPEGFKAAAGASQDHHEDQDHTFEHDMISSSVDTCDNNAPISIRNNVQINRNFSNDDVYDDDFDESIPVSVKTPTKATTPKMLTIALGSTASSMVAKAPPVRKHTFMSLESLQTSSVEDYGDLEFEESHATDDDATPTHKSQSAAAPSNKLSKLNLASKLKQKLSAYNQKDSVAFTTSTSGGGTAGSNSSAGKDDEMDNFLQNQFEHKDFLQDEAKDINFRASRDIVEKLSKIRPETITEDQLIELVNQVLTILSSHSELHDHLISSYGVMPIMDMFDLQFIPSYTFGLKSIPSHYDCLLPEGDSSNNNNNNNKETMINEKTYCYHVLRIVNTIIERSEKVKEQLSLVGIIPVVIHLFEKVCQSIVKPMNYYTSASYVSPLLIILDLTTGGGAGSTNAAMGPKTPNGLYSAASVYDIKPTHDSHQLDLLYSELESDSSLHPVATEAAKFIHLITSPSSSTSNNSGNSSNTNTSSYFPNASPMVGGSNRHHGNSFFSQPGSTAGGTTTGGGSNNIPSSSSNTLQMFIGAGGLSALCTMVSFGGKIKPMMRNNYNNYNNNNNSNPFQQNVVTALLEQQSMYFSNPNPISINPLNTINATAATAAINNTNNNTNTTYNNYSSNNYNNNTMSVTTDPLSPLVSPSSTVQTYIASPLSPHPMTSFPTTPITPQQHQQHHSMDFTTTGTTNGTTTTTTGMTSPLKITISHDNVSDTTPTTNNTSHSQLLSRNDSSFHTMYNDSKPYIEIFQMGLSCIARVFAVQKSRTRDFCRLFVKLGLLPHLAISFENLMAIYLSSLRPYATTSQSQLVLPVPVTGTVTGTGTLPTSARKNTRLATKSYSDGAMFHDSSYGISTDGSGKQHQPVYTTSGTGSFYLTTTSATTTNTSTTNTSTNTTNTYTNTLINAGRPMSPITTTTTTTATQAQQPPIQLQSLHKRTVSGSGLNTSNHNSTNGTNGNGTGGASTTLSRSDSTASMESDTNLEQGFAQSIAQLFFKFSRSDSIVARAMAKPEQGIVIVILNTLRYVLGYKPPMTTTTNGVINDQSSSSSPLPIPRRMRTAGAGFQPAAYLEIIELLLKCLKHLTMEPLTLDDLETAGTIHVLVPLLDGPVSERCKAYIIPCLFNMCRIHRRRQELAASVGIIPHLKRIVQQDSHLKQFVLPLMFDLAHTSNNTREELWKNDCVTFYLSFLKENYWQTFALNSLTIWLSNDITRVSRLLVLPANLSKLIEFFRTATPSTVQTLHKPLYDMMYKSKELSCALSASGIYVTTLVKRLQSTKEAIILRSFLKMLQLLHQNHPCPRQLVLDHNLYRIVKEFSQSEGQVLVCQLANRLLSDFQLSTLT